MIIDRQFVGGGGGGGSVAAASWGTFRGVAGEGETPLQIAADIVMSIISKSLGQHAMVDTDQAFYSSLQTSPTPGHPRSSTRSSEGEVEGEFDALLRASDRRLIMKP